MNEKLAQQAVATALEQAPQFREFEPTLIYHDIPGGAYMVRFASRPPQGTPGLWEFQNLVVRTYKQLDGLTDTSCDTH